MGPALAVTRDRDRTAAGGPGQRAQPADGPRLIRLVAAVGLRGGGAGLMLLQNALLARVAGAAALGVFFIAHAWWRAVGMGATLGLPAYVLRRSAALWDSGRDAAAHLLIRRSRLVGTVAGLGVAAVTALGATLLHRSGTIGWPVFAIAVSVGVGAAGFASTRLLADALKARGHAERALILEFALPSGAACTVLAVVLAGGWGLSVGWMLVVVTGATAVVPLAGWIWWDLRLAGSPRTTGRWMGGGWDVVGSGDGEPTGSLASLAPRSLAHLTAVGGLNVILWVLPTLIMPFFVADADVARFGIAHRVIAVGSLNIVALGSHFGPRFAAAGARRHHVQLRREAGRAAAATFGSYLPFFLVFVTWPGIVLGLFGASFAAAAPLLVIMACGQLVNAATGLCSQVLIMTGHERWEVGSTLVGVLLILLTTPPAAAAFGVTGVAVTFAGAVALRNAISFLLVRRVTREDAGG